MSDYLEKKLSPIPVDHIKVVTLVGLVAEGTPATFFQQSLGVGLRPHCLWLSTLHPRGGPTTPC